MKIKFEKKYGLYCIGLIATMALLALFLHDKDFSKSVGNVIFVILLYCLSQTFFEFNKKTAIIAAAVFCLLLEVSKTFGWVQETGLSNNLFFANLFGVYFDFDNIWSVIAGGALVYVLEFYDDNTRPRKKKFFGF